MATEVKVVTRDGQFGLILHKHGNSGWHSASDVHNTKLGKEENDTNNDSHVVHQSFTAPVLKALQALADGSKFEYVNRKDEKVTFTADAKTLAEEFKACAEGTPQEFWNIAWKAKLATRKAKREAAEESEEVAEVAG